jgi:hypothetical protein
VAGAFGGGKLRQSSGAFRIGQRSLGGRSLRQGLLNNDFSASNQKDFNNIKSSWESFLVSTPEAFYFLTKFLTPLFNYESTISKHNASE